MRYVGIYGIEIQDTDETITRLMHIAGWILKATDAQSQCVILNIFPRQRSLR
jgi:hypothetical protein